ncbi:MAG: tRNA epoxyqueuosine(34) reductase QueG [Bacteroidota bacterium]|nr:tRNA epoxyqueuosine(34) reductase QueG [Candidatus Kapabacteria bacterium]MDW8220836.1 tRNA epoxyqueuosine(34) reductase QueG [Bacteroidota bacterium]
MPQTMPTLSLESCTQHIKRTALNLGFSLVGIAKAEPLDNEIASYSEWLRRGFHAELGYMERNIDKRHDVRHILPSTRSVIVVGHNYFTPHQHSTSDKLGKISRYAWGDDYHDVIPPKLERLAQAVKDCFPTAETKIYTDTGAILEKQWAVRAGLGWQGKHSNIISREIGSWFFLGIVLTTAELLYDRPIGDYCGTCTACLEACPTQAIAQPYVVDARRCIAYWTIEAKPHHDIPSDIATQLDSWIFGCDTCQDVCPWNRFQKPTTEQRFEPRNGETSLGLDTVRAMTQKEFSDRFRKSPVKRTKLAGLQRNARALETYYQHQGENIQQITTPESLIRTEY